MEIYFTIIFVVCIVIFFFLLHRHQSKKHIQSKVLGIKKVSCLKKLISLTQSHRGLSSSWLSGDHTKQLALKQIVKNIQDVIQELTYKHDIKTISRWDSFNDHWSRLRNKKTITSANDNFHQHTQIIRNLLYLLEDEAEHCNLNKSHLPELPNIGYVWRELLVTAENIGQSRALGTAVATTKTCSSVDKIRLSFLHKHIETTTNQILTKLSSLKELADEHEKLLSTARVKVAEFTRLIQRELIETKQVTIDHNEYFTLASDSMKSLDDIFNHQLKQVEQVIS